MKMNRVYIKKCDKGKLPIAEIFEDLNLNDVEGKRVFIKPNMFRAAAPDEAVVTQPELISEAVSFLVNKGADICVGDNPVPNKRCGETEVALACGFVEVSQGRFRNIGRYPKKLIRRNNMLKEIYISREIIDCDLLISLPKFRTHDLTTMTLSIKNHFGIIPGGLKPFIHSRFPKIADFSKVLLEIYNIRPPDIIVVDCLNVIDAQGKRFTPGLLVAGNNGHAVDYVCALIAGIKPEAIPTLRIAGEQGMFDPNNVEINGRLEVLKGYATPFRFPFRNAIVESVAKIIYRLWLGRVPVMDSARCSKCLSCENVCPVKAVKNQKIDYKKCIKCYCCLEVCPNGAIRTQFKIS